MDRSKLLIGAYCLQGNARTEAHVKAIHDCGVDFIIGLSAKDRATLDLFAKHGVGAIVNGVVPGWWGGNGENAGKMREKNPPAKYAAGAAAFKDHPAIWAVDIGDRRSRIIPPSGPSTSATSRPRSISRTTARSCVSSGRRCPACRST